MISNKIKRDMLCNAIIRLPEHDGSDLNIISNDEITLKYKEMLKMLPTEGFDGETRNRKITGCCRGTEEAYRRFYEQWLWETVFWGAYTDIIGCMLAIPDILFWRILLCSECRKILEWYIHPNYKLKTGIPWKKSLIKQLTFEEVCAY